jgi:hypothetical protein
MLPRLHIVTASYNSKVSHTAPCVDGMHAVTKTTVSTAATRYYLQYHCLNTRYCIALDMQPPSVHCRTQHHVTQTSEAKRTGTQCAWNAVLSLNLLYSDLERLQHCG